MNRTAFLACAMVLVSCNASSTELEDGDPLGCVVALMIESKNAKSHGNFELPQLLSPFTKWYAIAGEKAFSAPEGKGRVMNLAKEYDKDWKRRKAVAKQCVATAVAHPGFEKSLPDLNKIPEITIL